MSEQTIKSTVPDKPVNGASLTRDSVAGRKTQFINRTSDGGVSFTLTAGQIAWVSTNVVLWSDILPEVARNTDNLVSWDGSISWQYLDCYIDSEASTNYIGASTLTSGQKLVKMQFFDQITPNTYSGSTAMSHSSRILVENDDVSSHTIYLYARAKYLISGDENL